MTVTLSPVALRLLRGKQGPSTRQPHRLPGRGTDRHADQEIASGLVRPRWLGPVRGQRHFGTTGTAVSSGSCGGRLRRMRSKLKGLGGRQILPDLSFAKKWGIAAVERLLHPVTALHSVSHVASPEQYQDKDIYNPNNR